jgi:hypothetical protein
MNDLSGPPTPPKSPRRNLRNLCNLWIIISVSALNPEAYHVLVLVNTAGIWFRI